MTCVRITSKGIQKTYNRYSKPTDVPKMISRIPFSSQKIVWKPNMYWPPPAAPRLANPPRQIRKWAVGRDHDPQKRTNAWMACPKTGTNEAQTHPPNTCHKPCLQKKERMRIRSFLLKPAKKKHECEKKWNECKQKRDECTFVPFLFECSYVAN